LHAGHSVGNHTYDHLNGWYTDVEKYISNVGECAAVVDSKLMRPPYGRIKNQQARALKAAGYKIVMWNILSGDFDKELPNAKCLKNVIDKTVNGDIIVMHDSEKAFERLQYVLPRVLKYFTEKGYRFEKIEIGENDFERGLDR